MSGSRRSSPNAHRQRSARRSLNGDERVLNATMPADVAMERILMKLELLDYRSTFCKQKKPYRAPLHRMFFSTPPSSISNGQFATFTQLSAWLLGKLGREMAAPKEFDDPSVVCMNLINELKMMGYPSPAFSIAKLHKGHGPEVLPILDLDGSVSSDDGYRAAIEEEREDSDDSDDLMDEIGSRDESLVDEKTPGFGGDLTKNVQPGDAVSSAVDKETWREETIRLAPQLILSVPQDWRQHLHSAHTSLEQFCQVWNRIEKHSSAMVSDIDHQLGKIKAKEENVNRRFGKEIRRYEQKHRELEGLNDQIETETRDIDSMRTELEKEEETLRQVASQIEEKTASLSDATPVVESRKMKETLTREISDFQLSINLLSHSLLHSSLHYKRVCWISSDDDESGNEA